MISDELIKLGFKKSDNWRYSYNLPKITNRGIYITLSDDKSKIEHVSVFNTYEFDTNYSTVLNTASIDDVKVLINLMTKYND